jgi:hypothetical protein
VNRALVQRQVSLAEAVAHYSYQSPPSPRTSPAATGWKPCSREKGRYIDKLPPQVSSSAAPRSPVDEGAARS